MVVSKSTHVGSSPTGIRCFLVLLCSSMAEQLTVNQHVRGSNPLLAASDIDNLIFAVGGTCYDVFMSLIFSFLCNLNKSRTK